MPIVNNKLVPSPDGIYHAATFCCPDASAVGNFEFIAGKDIVWTMVSNVFSMRSEKMHRPIQESGFRGRR